MGKRGKPKRIIRCGKPKACPECGHKKLLEVVYGMPSEEVVDNIAEYDIRGCCMGPFREVKIKDKSGNVYICLLYTSPSPRDNGRSRMPSSA